MNRGSFVPIHKRMVAGNTDTQTCCFIKKGRKQILSRKSLEGRMDGRL